jgi:hypothetical protein
LELDALLVLRLPLSPPNQEQAGSTATLDNASNKPRLRTVNMGFSL